MRCRRYFSFAYVVKWREAAKGAALLGDISHWILENLVRDGTPLPFSPSAMHAVDYLGPGPWGWAHIVETQRLIGEAARIVESGLHLTPAVGSGTVEGHFRFESEGLHFQGYKDFSRSGAIPLVLDYKTTSDFKWVKRGDKLAFDPQTLTYGFDALLKNPEAREVDFHWLYFRTRGAKKSELVPLRLSREHIVEGFGELREIAREAAAIVGAGTLPEALEPNTSACGMFGGCPYLATCVQTMTPNQANEAYFMSNDPNTMSVMARLKAKQAALSAGNGPKLMAPSIVGVVTSEVNIVPQNVPEPPVSEVRPTEDNAETIAAASAWYLDPNHVAYWDPATVKLRNTHWEGTGEIQAINPPEYQPPPTAEEREGKATNPDEPAPKRKPGRPKGATAKAEPAALVIPNVEAAIEAVKAGDAPSMAIAVVRELEAQPAPQIVNIGERSRVLYIDCLPEGDNSTPAEWVYQKAQALVLEKTGQSDYRLVDFGKGAPVFALAVQAVLEQNSLGAITVSTHADESRVAMSALRGWATKVIRGLR